MSKLYSTTVITKTRLVKENKSFNGLRKIITGFLTIEQPSP
jgi:hypothetical protein